MENNCNPSLISNSNMPNDLKLLFLLLSDINNSINFGLVLYPCQQYIPNVLKPFLGYFFSLDISIIIFCGKPCWDNHILYFL